MVREAVRRMVQHGAVLKLERPPARSFLCLFWQLPLPYHTDLHPALSKPTAIGTRDEAGRYL